MFFSGEYENYDLPNKGSGNLVIKVPEAEMK